MVEMAVSVGRALDRPMPQADSVTVRLAAARAAGMAGELRRLQGVLSGSMGRQAGWSGAAELAFQDSVAAEVARFAPAVRRYEGYAAALAGYARELDWVAPGLLAARARLAAGTDPAAAAAWSAEFERCWQQWDAARRRCAAGLAVAGRIDPDPHRHAWTRLASGITHAVGHAVGLDELSRTLADLGQALLVAGLVLSLVCPPAAGAVWAAVAVVAVCQLAVDLSRRQRGEQVGLATVGMDALGALPIGRLATGIHTAAEADAAIQRLTPELRHSRLVPGGGLAAHEGTATYRGHTLLKHVGKTPKNLAQRFVTEPQLGWSSSFTDRQVAETAISEVMEEHRLKLTAWIEDSADYLVLDSKLGWQVGSSISRDGAIIGADKVRVVLRKENTVLRYYVKTAFPTP